MKPTAADTLRESLRSDLARLAQHNEALRSEASEVLAGTTPAQWNWSPDRGTWSMALVLEHLNSVADKGLPAIERALAELRTQGAASDTPPQYSFGERFFIRLLSPNPPFRVPVPPLYVPAPPADPAGQTGPAFLAALDRTQKSIAAANGLDLTRVKVASPANPMMRMSVGAWLEGLVAHNDYHWLQVRALRSHAGFPRP